MKGSRLRMCEWVNDRPGLFETYFSDWPTLGEFRSGELLEWLCPLKADECKELRDGVWTAAGLPAPTPVRAGFWPQRGPTWDGAAVVAGKDGTRGVMLVEAKSHVGELKSPGTAAEGDRLADIKKALAQVQADLGVSGDIGWHQTYYQLTNRLAWLWYMRKRGIEAWLVAVYFTGDYFNGGSTKRVFPTDAADWQTAISAAKSAIGLTGPHKLSDWMRDIFVPAQPSR